MTNVLLLSDNKDFSSDLKEQIELEIKDYDVYEEYNSKMNIDIAIIDEKAEVLEGIHKEQVKAPVYLLSSEEANCPPYIHFIQKPFKLAHLLDELKSCISRFENSEDGYLYFNQYELHPNMKEILNLNTGKTVKLTEKEVAVIKYLYKADDRIVTKGELLEEVWGYSPDASTHTIETHIYRLRQKVEKGDENHQLIATEEGGYKLAKKS